MLWPLQPARATPGEVVVGQVLREATMQGLNGPSRGLSSYRGQPLIINVWASWCGPCRAEMASLERLAWSGAAQPFTLIGISTDDHPEAARAWLQRSNATFNHYIDRALELENMLGATRLPLTILVDGEGRVLDKVYGARDWDSPAAIAAITRAFRRAAAPKGKAAPALRSASAPP
jgi:thiol-disulfide isomerase/thioredoxin